MRTRYSIVLFAACFVIACVMVACSGGSSPAPPPEDTARARAETPEEAKRRQALERLKVRQEAACEQVSPVVTECAYADAKATMSAEEFAKYNDEALRRKHRAEYFEGCLASDMSPRQVKVFEDCLADTRCEVFLDCLDQARPQTQQPQPAR